MPLTPRFAPAQKNTATKAKAPGFFGKRSERQAITGGWATGNRINVRGRTGNPRGAPKELFDRYGLSTKDPKYHALGPRGKENVAIALKEGITFKYSSGTVEEMVVYGELRRRGYQTSAGLGPQWFEFQANVAGKVVDFLVYDGTVKISIESRNKQWHGQQKDIAADDERADKLLARSVSSVYWFWTPEALSDSALTMRFNQWLGPAAR